MVWTGGGGGRPNERIIPVRHEVQQTYPKMYGKKVRRLIGFLIIISLSSYQLLILISQSNF